MKIGTIRDLLEARVLVGEDRMGEHVYSACGSDMMSDVLAYVKDQAVLLTGLVNAQVIRTAEMMDMRCIVFVRSKQPSADMIQLAEESGINMMTVSKAYQLLKQEGYISTDRRSGTVVTPRADEYKPSPETLNKLRLCVSELRIAGVSCEELMNLCRQMYEEGER